jgi:signal peptidase II
MPGSATPQKSAGIGVSPLRGFSILIAGFVVVADRLTKWLVAASIGLHDLVVVVPGFFHLTHLRNRGAAFGLFDDSRGEWQARVLIAFSLMALVVVAGLLWRNNHALSVTGIGLALILGGAAGNLWDRLAHRYVIDFLDFHLGAYHWPAFNLADSAIVVGALLLISEIIFAKRQSA